MKNHNANYTFRSEKITMKTLSSDENVKNMKTVTGMNFYWYSDYFSSPQNGGPVSQSSSWTALSMLPMGRGPAGVFCTTYVRNQGLILFTAGNILPFLTILRMIINLVLLCLSYVARHHPLFIFYFNRFFPRTLERRKIAFGQNGVAHMERSLASPKNPKM